jgi:hypothetical protein
MSNVIRFHDVKNGTPRGFPTFSHVMRQAEHTSKKDATYTSTWLGGSNTPNSVCDCLSQDRQLFLDSLPFVTCFCSEFKILSNSLFNDIHCQL